MNRVFFSMVGLAALPGVLGDGDVVVPGPLFRVGKYPDKDFELTEAEADAAVAAFTGADMNSEHENGGFLGKLVGGQLGKIKKLWREGEQLMAEYQVPKWLAGLAKDKGVALKTSAEWDRTTKQLVGAAWTLNPYLKENELVAAFSADQSPELKAILEENRNLKEQLDQKRAEELRTEAAKFAANLVSERRALPAERDALVALFCQLHADDTANPDPVVKFNATAQPVSRLAAFKAMCSARPPHNLLDDLLDPTADAATIEKTVANFRALTNKAKDESLEDPAAANDPTKVPEERRRQLLSLTVEGRAALAAKAKR